MTENDKIAVFVEPECAIGEKHIDFYDQMNLDRCSHCGSSLFRNYCEHTVEGCETHQICAVCNSRLGGLISAYNEELHYYCTDFKHPFMCIPIKVEDIASFDFDILSGEPAAVQFMNHIESLGYHVTRLTPKIINCGVTV
ncbi:MAG: hypothetical protein WC346_02270 [Methanogenium sp.]|jgi:hypothetical protein